MQEQSNTEAPSQVIPQVIQFIDKLRRRLDEPGFSEAEYAHAASMLAVTKRDEPYLTEIGSPEQQRDHFASQARELIE
jgi:hypothetical protein